MRQILIFFFSYNYQLKVFDVIIISNIKIYTENNSDFFFLFCKISFTLIFESKNFESFFFYSSRPFLWQERFPFFFFLKFVIVGALFIYVYFFSKWKTSPFHLNNFSFSFFFCYYFTFREKNGKKKIFYVWFVFSFFFFPLEALVILWKKKRRKMIM